jgi:hypothetical protein
LWRRLPDADLLREMIGFAAQRLMEIEVQGLTGAAGVAHIAKLPDFRRRRRAVDGSAAT